MNIFKRLIFICLLTTISLLFCYYIFYPIYISDSIIIDTYFRSFNICTEQPLIWIILKYLFIFTYLFSNIIIFNFIFSKFNIKKIIIKKDKSIINNNLSLAIGLDNLNNIIYLPEKGLYQNILVTGTIGTGKTSSAIYPFTKQLIEYMYENNKKKLGMLILDVKGNFLSKVYDFADNYNRLNDVIAIDLSGNIKYNPLDKPNLKASILANRLKTILLLFSPNNSESFWIDTAEKILTECIKLCRLYNDGYVTFEELHNLVIFPNYYEDKIFILKEKFINNIFSKEDCYNLLSALNFFINEYSKLDERTLSILRAEISRITNLFISDYEVKNVFCPNKSEINFFGFDDLINTGKIVVLNMNIANYNNLSKVIAAYLKLDFQTEVINRLSNKNIKTVCFICDEYQEYATTSDSNFFSQSREAKCINIISTQSYSSLLNTLNNQSSVKVIVQNLVNKLWLRSDDIFTIEDAQKQIGKEDKEKLSKTISENAKETNFNYFFNTFNSKNSNISESYNSYFQNDFIYDINFFTQDLKSFECLSFLSDGNKILKPQKIKLIPYFEDFNDS